VPVVIAALGESLAGRVAEIAPAVDPGSRTFTAKIDLPRHGRLSSGMFGKAVFAAGSRESLTVPAEAVVERGQLQSVFVAESGTARQRMVSLGTAGEGRYEVLAGLSAGEQVILDARSVKGGQPVEITKTVAPLGSPAAVGGVIPASEAGR
jgi:multidrug efflux pump subunit AcrA (membrane-fusion protein)